MTLIEKILRDLSFLDYLPNFQENDICDDVLPEVSAEDLKEIGIVSLGHRKKILGAIRAVGATEEKDQSVSLERSGSDHDQRREVAVLFADLTNYTKLTQQLVVEDIHNILSDLYEYFDAIVRRMGGTVARHIGDCVMAVFGAPVSYGNDVERALRCSIEMHEAMRMISRKHGQTLSVHIGVAAGRVLYSAKGYGTLAEAGFTVTGDSINLASRLAERASGSETLISEMVYQSMRDRMECEKIDEVEAKGFEEAVTCYHFVGFKTHSIERKFVGRTAEIAMAKGVLTHCSETAPGQTLYIRGEAGLGKTALLDQMALLATERNFDCHRVLLLNSGLGDDERAAKVILSELSEISVGATEDAIDTVANEYRSAGILDEWGVYFFNMVLGLKPEGAVKIFLESLDNVAQMNGRLDMICRIVEASSKRNPLLISIEDLHWADDEALALILRLAAITSDLPVLLVLTSRVEGDPLGELWQQGIGKARFVQMDLSPLSQSEALEFLVGFPQAPTKNLIDQCLAKAEGNPLFLDQLLRHASETDSGAVPGTIQSLVQSRIDRLAVDDRRILNAAAVLGQRFKMVAATSIAGIEVYDERHLIDASLIRPFGGDLLFSHALIRDGVYQTILRDELHQLHQNAANWFEGRDNLLFAEHLEKSRSDKAAEAYLVVARDAAAERRLEAACNIIEHGRTLAPGHGTLFEYLLLDGELLRDLGRGEKSIAAFEDAGRIANTSDEMVSAQIGLIATMRILDRLDDASELIAEAEDVALKAEQFANLSKLNYLRGSISFPRGDFKGCLNAHTKALNYAEEANQPELTAQALSGLGDAYYAQGRMFKAHGVFEKCLDLCRQHGLSAVESANRFMLGTVKIYMNETERALEEASRSAELAQKIGQLRPEIVSRLTAGWILQSMGQHGEARNEIDRGMEAAGELGAKRFEPFLQETTVRILLSQGERREAARLASKVLDQARELNAMNFIGPWVLATTAMTREKPAERQALLDEGEKLLKKGCVGHNYFRFYVYAIFSCSEAADWKHVRHFCDALDKYTRSEPTPWSEFYIRLGRTIADFSDGSSSARAHLEELVTEADRAKFLTTERRIRRLLVENN